MRRRIRKSERAKDPDLSDKNKITFLRAAADAAALFCLPDQVSAARAAFLRKNLHDDKGVIFQFSENKKYTLFN